MIKSHQRTLCEPSFTGWSGMWQRCCLKALSRVPLLSKIRGGSLGVAESTVQIRIRRIDEVVGSAR